MGKVRKEKVKLEFTFSLKAVRQLDALVENTKAKSRAEIIRDALRTYEYLVKKIKEGYKIELSNKEGNKIKVTL